MAASRGEFQAVARAFAEYRTQVMPATSALAPAEPWSLFNATVRRAHVAALRACRSRQIKPR
jgi:hypothetical protein